MIVCSCNVLTDHQVREAVSSGAANSPVRVHGCLGCSAKCGRCIRTIRKIMDDALTTSGCSAGCTCCATREGTL